MTPGVAVVMASTLAGAVGLLGVRDLLGPWGYRLCMLPLGVLGWSLVTLVTMTVGAVWWRMTVVPALAAWVILLYVVARVAARRSLWPRDVRLDIGDLLFLVGVWIVSVGASASGITLFTNDSWLGYELSGWRLWATGGLTASQFGWRSLVLPSVHAAHRFFGGEWTFLPYLIFALNVVLLLGYALMRTMTLPRRRETRVVVTGIVILLMVSLAPFVWQSIHVHSHIPTALYLLLGTFALVEASRWFDKGEHGGSEVWAVVAGLSSAGVILTRPDGLAYAFVVHGLCSLLLLLRRIDGRATGMYYAVSLVPFAVTLAVLVANEGLYAVGERVSATTYVALLLVSAGFGTGSVVVSRRLSAESRWRRPAWAFGALGAGMVLAVAVTYVLRTETMRTAVEVAWVNLTDKGGWNSFWAWAAILLMIATLASIRKADRDDWQPFVLSAALIFVTVVATVHGSVHPGRRGWSDSLNRLVFHVVPLLFWLFGLTVTRLAERIGRTQREL